MKKVFISFAISIISISLPLLSQEIYIQNVFNTRRFNISYSSMILESSTQVSGGWGHSLILTRGGKVFSWGDNGSGQLGKVTTTIRTKPGSVIMPELENDEIIEKIFTQSEHSFALTSNGRILGWGDNSQGQVGDGTKNNLFTPTFISINGLHIGETIQSMSLGDGFTLALTTLGRLFSWGFNGSGQLGDSTTTSSIVPKVVLFTDLQDSETIQYISAGSSHSLAITNIGNVYAWGSNLAGKLGDGTTVQKLVPTLIDFFELNNGESIISVSAGSSHTLALSTSGRIFSWGYNASGRLGDGTTNNKNTPTLITFPQLENGEKIQNIHAAGYHSLALSTMGRVFSWGRNGSGQLGDGTLTNKLIPTLISISQLQNDETIKQLSAGSTHSLAVTTTGRIFSWGSNFYGELGNGTLTIRTSPDELNTIFSSTLEVVNFKTFMINQRITLPNPVMEGQIFVGWYMDEALTNPFSLLFMPDNDLFLYAKFTPIASQG
jgi:uncharacterized repeat protein (TIGR02543 family)